MRIDRAQIAILELLRQMSEHGLSRGSIAAVWAPQEAHDVSDEAVEFLTLFVARAIARAAHATPAAYRLGAAQCRAAISACRNSDSLPRELGRGENSQYRANADAKRLGDLEFAVLWLPGPLIGGV